MGGKTKFKLHRPTKNDYPYGMLSPEVRLVIGIRQSANVSDRQVADELECNLRELRQFERKVATDEICGWVRLNGLPASFGESIAKKVQCVKCKNWIFHVPCVQCCTFQGDTSRNDAEPELPFDPLATDAIPGSPEKIAIMADRVKFGFSIFSPQDRCDFAPRTKQASN